MTDYKHVFDEALAKSREINYKETFINFHQWPTLYHFIIAPPHLLTPDTDSLNQAKEINYDIYARLFLKGPSLIGGGSEQLDAIESRHILMITNLIDKIGTDWGDVLEIGGGYGNWLRLIQGIVNYNSWTILDLPYILELQKWFLTECGVDLDRIRFVQDTHQTHALTIGAHSLSEFSAEDFNKYYDHAIKKSKYVFYACQKESALEKLVMITADFFTRDSRAYEGGTSAMYVFENKND